MLAIDKNDVVADVPEPQNLHLTRVDAYRIATSLVGLGILPNSVLSDIRKELGLRDSIVPTIMHPNQHYHLVRWLKAKGIGGVGDKELDLLKKEMAEVAYESEK